MLTENQIAGIKDLCKYLKSDVVTSVAETATKGKLALITLDDAIEALILHSDSALWLLNRKKLTRSLLFEYLNAKKIPISGKAEKIDVITRILEYWNSAPFSTHVANCEPAIVSSHPTTATATHHHTEENAVFSQKPKMGLEFAKWFYEILLAVHKQSIPREQIVNQFWKDVKLRITLNTASVADSQEAIGDQEAALLLSILVCQHACILNPNLSDEGIREKTSAHGLVMIAVCGTVHQNENCTGIFEQAFGLVQDPASDFAWRIKWSDLRVTQAAVSQAPCLSDLPELMAICDGSTS